MIMADSQPGSSSITHHHHSATERMAQVMMGDRPGNDRSVMETIVRAATAANNLFLKNCNVCTVYCDKQVEYESVVEQYKIVTSSAAGIESRTLEDLFKAIDTRSQHEVERCQQYLFDEESVVRQVRSRSEDEDDEES